MVGPSRVLAITAAVVGLAGCGSGGVVNKPGAASDLPSAATSPTPTLTSSPPVPTTMPRAPHYDPDLLLTTGWAATMIDGRGQPTELCLGAIFDSLPPQCGGPQTAGFDWSEHRGDYSDVSGVKFGDFLVEGRYDGVTFTVTKAVPLKDLPPQHGDASLRDQFKTPCAPPPGGWRVLDPAKTSEASQERTFAAAEKLPGYADAWVDQSRNPLDGKDPVTESDEQGMNDPTLLTINVRVTRDLAGAERTLRRLWGGALCVSKAVHTDKELAAIQKQMQHLPGLTGTDRSQNVVHASVEYDDGSLQAWADQKYGPGLVEISSMLRPVRD